MLYGTFKPFRFYFNSLESRGADFCRGKSTEYFPNFSATFFLNAVIHLHVDIISFEFDHLQRTFNEVTPRSLVASFNERISELEYNIYPPGHRVYQDWRDSLCSNSGPQLEPSSCVSESRYIQILQCTIYNN